MLRNSSKTGAAVLGGATLASVTLAGCAKKKKDTDEAISAWIRYEVGFGLKKEDFFFVTADPRFTAETESARG